MDTIIILAAAGFFGIVLGLWRLYDGQPHEKFGRLFGGVPWVTSLLAGWVAAGGPNTLDDVWTLKVLGYALVATMTAWLCKRGMPGWDSWFINTDPITGKTREGMAIGFAGPTLACSIPVAVNLGDPAALVYGAAGVLIASTYVLGTMWEDRHGLILGKPVGPFWGPLSYAGLGVGLTLLGGLPPH